MFISKKSRATPLPINWPSPFHNKCDRLDCHYPNAPQGNKGTYSCEGVSGGFPCRGVFKVSSALAFESGTHIRANQHDEEYRRHLQKRNQQFAPNPPPIQRSGQVYGRGFGREQLSEISQLRQVQRLERHSKKKREERKLREYQEDQLAKQRYPGYSVRQRWI